MDFVHGVITAVGVLVAISLVLIAISPDEIIQPRAVVEEKSVSLSLPTSFDILIPVGSLAPGCQETLECYLPYRVAVSAGAAVTWTNDDTGVHTVTSGDASSGSTGLFDSGLILAGETFEYTFNDAGTFDYFCVVHPWMTGIVDVS